MKFCDIARAVGVKEYPPLMEEFYVAKDQTPACDLAMFQSLQQQYKMFGDYYDIVMEYARKVNDDPARSAWVRTAVAFAKAGDFDQAKSVPVPEPDGTMITSMLPFYILAAQIPGAMDAYRSKGFPEDEVVDMMKVFRGSLATVEARTGMPGTNTLYYGWDSHYAKCQIFKIGGLQFEMRKLPGRAVYLQNRSTGEVIPVLCSGTYHRSGIQELGSAGYTDEEGAFTCAFREDEENYYGNGVWDSVVSAEAQTFPKTEWDCVMRPGDRCLGMHIPRNADISMEATDAAIHAARELIKERFPEFDGEKVYCSSWLLDPTLGKVLGENAKITAFQNRYVRYPQLSAGKHIFGYVFDKNVDSYETLPEDTRLRRALKQLYLDGGYIYGYSGLIY